MTARGTDVADKTRIIGALEVLTFVIRARIETLPSRRRFDRAETCFTINEVTGMMKILGTLTADRFHNKNSKLAIMENIAQTRSNAIS